MKYSIVVAATASEAAPLQYLAPFTGCTVSLIPPFHVQKFVAFLPQRKEGTFGTIKRHNIVQKQHSSTERRYFVDSLWSHL
jgi:F0F1-type ATP synthase alpha subunit